MLVGPECTASHFEIEVEGMHMHRLPCYVGDEIEVDFWHDSGHPSVTKCEGRRCSHASVNSEKTIRQLWSLSMSRILELRAAGF